MISEQLQKARAERWRQTANPIVTADDARAWVEGIGLCLFLPRRAHFSAPAPSFVEAVAGGPTDAPSREWIENAAALLHRLTAEGAVVPLNLFHAVAFGAGAATPVMGGVDQPDFMATREVLPYVFSLIGGRNWKSGPGDKVSPLMKEIWALLGSGGALTAQEIQRALGRELTETAVLRGLVELWGGLRAIPVYDGEVTRWELTQARFAAEMTASQKVAQSTALSALVSFYLDAVIAASVDEIETFLSPLVSRSRVREVVNGLQATRQLGLVSVNAQPLMHVAGALPEFEEAEPVKAEVRAGLAAGVAGSALAGGRARTERGPREKSKPGEERRPFERGGRREERGDYPRRGEGTERPRGERPYRKPFDKERTAEGGERGRAGRPYRKPFDKERRAEGGERGLAGRPYRKPFDKERRAGGGERGQAGRPYRKPFDKERRAEGGGERGQAGRPYRKPFDSRAEGERGQAGRPYRKPFDKERRAEGGERRERTEFRGGERRPGRFDGERRSGGGKFGGEKRFGAPKKFGSRGGSSAGVEGEKRPFSRDRAPGGESRSGVRFEQRGERGPRREPRQGKPEFRGSGKAKFGEKKFDERGAGNAGFKRPGLGKPRKPFGKPGKKFGKPQPGGAKRAGGRPGGFKPPFRKRKDSESESGE